MAIDRNDLTAMPLLEEAREADKVEQSDSLGKRRRANERH
jgi:hypothetical protein